MFLLPVFAGGIWRARRLIQESLNPRSIWDSGSRGLAGPEGVGRNLLLLCGLGLVAAGLTILLVGMTFVFVPQDVAFIGIQPDKLRAITPLLVPVLAHDRAGFGGGLLSVGLVLTMIVRHARLSRSLVEVIALMGLCGFGAALGVHFAIGYTDFVHLSPAYAGFVIFAIGAIMLGRSAIAKRSMAASNID
jgi:hypothetical protein